MILRGPRPSAARPRRLAHRPGIIATGLAVLLAAGCDREAADTSAANVPDEGEVVAEVDDRALTETDLDAQVQAMASRGDRPAREAALEERIDLQLLARQAEREEMHRQPETAAEIRRQRAMLLANQLIRSRIDQLDIGEEALRAAYEDYVAADGQRREYNVRHILVDSRDKARELIDEIENGADFGELARQHSTGPSAERGGNLDWFRPEEMVEPFADAVAELSREEYTAEPVETRFGWHVILLDDVRDNEPKPFEEMRDQLRSELVDDHIRSHLRELRDQADIEIHLDTAE